MFTKARWEEGKGERSGIRVGEKRGAEMEKAKTGKRVHSGKHERFNGVVWFTKEDEGGLKEAKCVPLKADRKDTAAKGVRR